MAAPSRALCRSLGRLAGLAARSQAITQQSAAGGGGAGGAAFAAAAAAAAHPWRSAPFATAAAPAKRLGLSEVSHIVAVASGKGGVGKSTVAGALRLRDQVACQIDRLFAWAGPPAAHAARASAAAACEPLRCRTQRIYECSRLQQHPRLPTLHKRSACKPTTYIQPNLAVRSRHAVCASMHPHLSPLTTLPAANLAVALATRLRLRVGLLDADVHGPSIPTLMNVEGEPLTTPGEAACELRVLLIMLRCCAWWCCQQSTIPTKERTLHILYDTCNAHYTPRGPHAAA